MSFVLLDEATTDHEAEALAESIAARLRGEAASLPLRPHVAEEIGREAMPAIHALLFAASTERAADPTSLEHHETTAMITLLGRSLALSGATPTAALGVVPALLTAFRQEGIALASSLERPLASVFMEGFVRGTEERVRASLERDLLARIAVLPLAPGCVLVVIRGPHDSEALGERLESVARGLFADQVRSVIVDLGPLEDPESPVIRPAIAFAESLRMVGIVPHLVLPTRVFEVFAPRASPAVRDVPVSSDVASAVVHAFDAAGLVVMRTRWLGRPLRDLLRARADQRRDQ